ncbi:YtxH domain-containing protein [Bacillus sp. USDA818B3_A]|uniref:YtxH domain-containing protein n=1 Tax=Bacillus sp. USDA818B3_A TaxID=2698834 RepID=UPI00136B0640|nr:YtxH domain-containing protein [Bacillus sp. USDA818B3_A]
MTSREHESRETNQSRNDEATGSFLLGAIIGGVVGAAAALLLAPRSGKELRSTIGSQADSIIDKTSSLRENVVVKGNELAAKTSSISQGIILQSSELVNKVTGKTTSKNDAAQESDVTYIPIHTPEAAAEKGLEKKSNDNMDIKKKLEEAQKAFDEEENKVRL